MHQEYCWWIADYRDATMDLYIIQDVDPLPLPVG